MTKSYALFEQESIASRRWSSIMHRTPGKTHLCIALGHAACVRGYSAGDYGEHPSNAGSPMLAAAAAHRLMNVENYSSLVLNASEWGRVTALVNSVRAVLAATHRAASPAREDFQIQTQQALETCRGSIVAPKTSMHLGDALLPRMAALKTEE